MLIVNNYNARALYIYIYNRWKNNSKKVQLHKTTICTNVIFRRFIFLILDTITSRETTTQRVACVASRCLSTRVWLAVYASAVTLHKQIRYTLRICLCQCRASSVAHTLANSLPKYLMRVSKYICPVYSIP